jgi:hypothetical protein
VRTYFLDSSGFGQQRAMNILLRFIFKAVLGLLAVVFAIGLVVTALIFLAVGTVTALLTGRKPSPAVMFGRFQRFSPQGMWPGGPSAPRENASAGRPGREVVDVEVREIGRDTH